MHPAGLLPQVWHCIHACCSKTLHQGTQVWYPTYLQGCSFVLAGQLPGQAGPLVQDAACQLALCMRACSGHLLSCIQPLCCPHIPGPEAPALHPSRTTLNAAALLSPWQVDTNATNKVNHLMVLNTTRHCLTLHSHTAARNFTRATGKVPDGSSLKCHSLCGRSCLPSRHSHGSHLTQQHLLPPGIPCACQVSMRPAASNTVQPASHLAALVNHLLKGPGQCIMVFSGQGAAEAATMSMSTT